MSKDDSWRSEAAYEYIDTLGPSELAWEFLRRNIDYRSSFQDLLSDGEASEQEAQSFASKWGLRFRRRSKSLGVGSASLLDASRRPGGHSSLRPSC
ncbi:transcriptional regulator domain-containing protein [Brevundimonas sp. VNH65]|uniref:transcriptional regulator domain-containing protein n=1 Tax=Brevundimonas sp. VNH65 TaxID=3400917 RepID=UPI003C0C40A5